MPHAVLDDDGIDARDDELIASLLNTDAQDVDQLDFSRELEPGEKADDAQDFEDIGDDDLADDEDEIVPNPDRVDMNGHSFDDTQDGADGIFDDGFDALFDDAPSPPTDGTATQKVVGNEDDKDDLHGLFEDEDDHNTDQANGIAPISHNATQLEDEEKEDSDLADETQGPSPNPVDDGSLDHIEDPAERAQLLEQLELFGFHRDRQTRTVTADIPPPPETDKELFRTIFPLFEEDKPVRWKKVLPQKRAYFVGKQPLKPPKSIQPSKVTLDLMPDQEKLFRLPPSTTAPTKTRAEEAAQRGLILVTTHDTQDKEEEESDVDDMDDNEPVGGFRWQDLEVVCADWDLSSSSDASEYGDIVLPPAKKQKGNQMDQSGLLHRFYEDFPSLEDPEATTAKLATKITLDMNDPHLMLHEMDANITPRIPRKPGLEFKRDVSGSFTRALSKRFNISNDEAYDALKENHHNNKVRHLIGTESLEHATPALRLQFPFYKVKMSARECRSFHRPQMHFKAPELAKVTKNRRVKRKLLKGLSAKEIYATSDSLSLADNSDMILFEYSEEQPMMMSNFGMHSRLINYYKRKDDADTQRPKKELGETSVLLPQDDSPFSKFGTVEPGEMTSALSNQMFRAPVFQHEPKNSDFLIIRSTTGENGHSWHVRNISNLMVVGQQFPNMEIPGTHSRKVTEAAKNRLKMIAYRIYRSNSRRKVKGALLSNEMIREHLPGTDIAQNRGKLREFMQYDKERASWNPNPAEYTDDAPVESLRKIVPETICLLDATQVGAQYLQDAGYNKTDNDQEDVDEDGETMEEQMAPWQLTKNFLNAAAGKAMVEIHGPGDPTGCSEAFSFIKVSMKGGFRALGESIEDQLDAQKKKANSGHNYNVATQEQKYREAITRTWNAQKQSLSSTVEQEGFDADGVDNVEEVVDNGREPTPHHVGGSQYGTPMRNDDDTMSQFSRLSRSSQKGKMLKITRTVLDTYGNPKTEREVIKNPRVIREYLKRQSAAHLEDIKKDLFNLKPTGDEAKDALRERALRDELLRLERNQERRMGREKAKGVYNPSNSDSPGTGKHVGTHRKFLFSLSSRRKDHKYADATSTGSAQCKTARSRDPRILMLRFLCPLYNRLSHLYTRSFTSCFPEFSFCMQMFRPPWR
ncbi:hypothetical protein EJ05DRAFT_476401 [Pseudovirgaria hyperparasitica]|uniref:Transcription initiation factor TFIID subunit 1 histone acetyltransferase domain-containing protein n=1 Tax=Pseudovirgaria hyperparasitica TaxID=470096 RepID=A0A6A6W7Z2_9PEZI|nr:uncharacterized protein EJ05DRAFT_476401 [Pseudovirgaria hyperparasitica]KAF2758144.1 hypothetical protein EJ05DRAFT_476401 [Pseudovirgaria hyperparasitica]